MFPGAYKFDDPGVTYDVYSNFAKPYVSLNAFFFIIIRYLYQNLGIELH